MTMAACAELDLRLPSAAMRQRTGRGDIPDPPLHDLPISPALRALAERGTPRRYRKGVVLIQEGDQGDTLYIVLSGRVRAYSEGDNEREITYGHYGPGEYVGEISLDGGPRSASVITVEPTTCVVIPRQTLLVHIGQYPEFAFELLAKVIRRARAATLTAKQLPLNDVYGRLRALLESLAVPVDEGEDGGDGAESPGEGVRLIAERLTQLDISHRVGCSREMISRLMKDLEQGGYVRTDATGLQLLKPLPARW
jgi:CRP/FNR family cyclic AMP-dependent transcriptional regulator